MTNVYQDAARRQNMNNFKNLNPLDMTPQTQEPMMNQRAGMMEALGREAGGLGMSAGLSDREAQLQQSFDQARSSILGTSAGLGMGQQAMPTGQQGIDEGMVNALRGETRPLTATNTPTVAQPTMNMQSTWDSIVGPAQIDALRGELRNLQPPPTPGLTPPPMGLTPQQEQAYRTEQARSRQIRSQAAQLDQLPMRPAVSRLQQAQAAGRLAGASIGSDGRLQPAQQAGQVQSAPPRTAPPKVQPAPTAAKVGQSMGQAIAQPQEETAIGKAQAKPKTAKQKEIDATGFVPTQRPKPKQGYGQGRA